MTAHTEVAAVEVAADLVLVEAWEIFLKNSSVLNLPKFKQNYPFPRPKLYSAIK